MHQLHDKVQVTMSPPTTIKELRCFLGCVKYYRPFLPHLAEVTSPLTKLLNVKQGTPKSPWVTWETQNCKNFNNAYNCWWTRRFCNTKTTHAHSFSVRTPRSQGKSLEQVFDFPRKKSRSGSRSSPRSSRKKITRLWWPRLTTPQGYTFRSRNECCNSSRNSA